MNQYPHYKLNYSTDNSSISESDLVAALCNIKPSLNWNNAPPTFKELFQDLLLWRSHTEDMKALAILYPDVKFTLYGNEKNMWIEYFYGDRYQWTSVQMIFDKPTIF